MLIAVHGVKIYAHTYRWSEALCSMLYMELSFMLIATYGVKFYAHCYKWIEDVCLKLYKE